MVNFPAKVPLRSLSPLFIATASTAIYIIFLCTVFDPRWETNDDIAMSMVAHGYGLAAYPSPNLIFSNVIWGYLVSAIPNFINILGYSWATLATLLISGTTILYSLLKLKVRAIDALVLVAMILLRPTLFPQFTINAGLMTIAAILGFLVYLQIRYIPILVFASILAFLGFLIRSQEMLMVIFIALPILGFRNILGDRGLQIALLMLTLAIALAVLFDHHAYQGEAWQSFDALNSARAPYTDFGLGELIKARSDILVKHGYTTNDIDLIRNFFFEDPTIADPSVLKEMAKEYGPIPFLFGGINAGLMSIADLISLKIAVMTMLFFWLFLLNPKRNISLSLIIFLSILFAIGIAGRGGILRIYVPPLILLVLAARISHNEVSDKDSPVRKINILRKLIFGPCLLALIASYILTFPQAALASKVIKEAQSDAANLPYSDILVSWGVGLRIESIFPLLANNTHNREIRIYPFGVFTHAPFSRAYVETLKGHSFTKRLKSSEGTFMVAAPKNIEQLGIWCHERWGGKLRKVTVSSSTLNTVTHVWCTDLAK